MTQKSKKPCTGSVTVDEVRLSRYTASIELGERATFVAQAYSRGVPCTGKTYRIIDNTDPTKVSAAISGQNGSIQGLSGGSSSVIVAVGTIQSAPLIVTVVAGAVATIELSPLSVSIDSGSSASLNYVAKNSHGVTVPATLTGASLDPSRADFGTIGGGIAQVNALAVVSTTTQVAVRAGSVYSNYVQITINAAAVPAPGIDEVRLSISSLALDMGQAGTFSAQAYAAGVAVPGQTYVISTNTSPDKATAAISSGAGSVTGLHVGSTTIKVSVGAVESLGLAVVVSAGALATLTLSPATKSLVVGATTTLTYVAKNSFGAVLPDPDVIGEATNTAVADFGGGAITGGSCLVDAIAAGGGQVRVKVGAVVSNWTTITVTASSGGSGPSQLLETVDEPELLDTARSSTPSVGTTLHVHSGDSLQAVMDVAVAGQNIEVDNGVVIPENLVWHGRAAGGYVNMYPTNGRYGEGLRATESVAASRGFPRILAPSGATPILSVAEAGDTRLRITNFSLEVDPGVGAMTTLVALGSGADASTATMPKNVILDQCIVKGHPTLEARRGIATQAWYLAIIDGTVKEIHSTGFDSQAILGWNGPGHYKITNNRLEASTEVVGMGGADPAFTDNVPSDIELRGNHITRPMAWKGNGFLEKNLIEFKVGLRTLVEGNIVENAWPAAQSGWGLELYAVNQNGMGVNNTVAHFTVRKNIFRNIGAGVQLNQTYGVTLGTNHLAINNNLFLGVNNPLVAGGDYGWLIEEIIPYLFIEHNTMFMPTASGSLFLMVNNSGTPSINRKVRNNLFGGGKYPIQAGPANYAQNVGAGSDFAGNVFAQVDAAYYGGLYGFPTVGNYFPTSIAGVDLVGGASAALDVGAGPDSLKLASTSPYKNKGTDGTDPGCDIDAVKAATANALVAG